MCFRVFHKPQLELIKIIPDHPEGVHCDSLGSLRG